MFCEWIHSMFTVRKASKAIFRVKGHHHRKSGDCMAAEIQDERKMGLRKYLQSLNLNLRGNKTQRPDLYSQCTFLPNKCDQMNRTQNEQKYHLIISPYQPKSRARIVQIERFPQKTFHFSASLPFRSSLPGPGSALPFISTNLRL